MIVDLGRVQAIERLVAEPVWIYGVKFIRFDDEAVCSEWCSHFLAKSVWTGPDWYALHVSIEDDYRDNYEYILSNKSRYINVWKRERDRLNSIIARLEQL